MNDHLTEDPNSNPHSTGNTVQDSLTSNESQANETLQQRNFPTNTSPTQYVSVLIDMTREHEENDGATYSDSQAQNVLQSRNNITTYVTRSEALVTGITQRIAEDPQTTAEPHVEGAHTSTETSTPNDEVPTVPVSTSATNATLELFHSERAVEEETSEMNQMNQDGRAAGGQSVSPTNANRNETVPTITDPEQNRTPIIDERVSSIIPGNYSYQIDTIKTYDESLFVDSTEHGMCGLAFAIATSYGLEESIIRKDIELMTLYARLMFRVFDDNTEYIEKHDVEHILTADIHLEIKKDFLKKRFKKTKTPLNKVLNKYFCFLTTYIA